jgi:hypothetical protein
MTGSSVVACAPISKRDVEKTIFRPKEQSTPIMVGLRLVYFKDDALRFFTFDNDNTNALVSSIEDYELEEIIQGHTAVLEKYSDLDFALLLPAAQKELERRKERRKEERTERLIKIADTRTTELLRVLEHIASKISNKPKTAIAVVILVPVAISILISLAILGVSHRGNFYYAFS